MTFEEKIKLLHKIKKNKSDVKRINGNNQLDNDEVYSSLYPSKKPLTKKKQRNYKNHNIL